MGAPARGLNRPGGAARRRRRRAAPSDEEDEEQVTDHAVQSTPPLNVNGISQVFSKLYSGLVLHAGGAAACRTRTPSSYCSRRKRTAQGHKPKLATVPTGSSA
jgi:hypothetical protein